MPPAQSVDLEHSSAYATPQSVASRQANGPTSVGTQRSAAVQFGSSPGSGEHVGKQSGALGLASTTQREPPPHEGDSPSSPQPHKCVQTPVLSGPCTPVHTEPLAQSSLPAFSPSGAEQVEPGGAGSSGSGTQRVAFQPPFFVDANGTHFSPVGQSCANVLHSYRTVRPFSSWHSAIGSPLVVDSSPPSVVAACPEDEEEEPVEESLRLAVLEPSALESASEDPELAEPVVVPVVGADSIKTWSGLKQPDMNAMTTRTRLISEECRWGATARQPRVASTYR